MCRELPRVFPPPFQPHIHRLLNVHPNKPGVLREINNILSEYNISSQLLSTNKNIGYLIIDIDSEVSKEVLGKIKSRKDLSICTRILF